MAGESAELSIGALDRESVARAGGARGEALPWRRSGRWARARIAAGAGRTQADAQAAGPQAQDAAQAARERAQAWRVCRRALFGSRLLVWAAGVGTVLAFGYGPVRRAFDPPGLTHGFGWLGNLLAAPAARWDAAWYLVIARYGYRPALGGYTSARDAFFPLYPLGVHAISLAGVPAVAAGVLLSLAALAAALYGIHRLTALELRALGEARASQTARLAVLLVAFAPMAFFLSAVYSESLYLALSVGLFWCARRGRWAWAGVLGALACATRSAGLVLLVPALILYLYGPRDERPADFARGARRAAGLALGNKRAAGLARVRALLAPRYRVRADVLWLVLLPLAVVAYGAYLGLAGGDALAPLSAQGEWGRHFAGPFVGAWDGLRAAFEGARQLLSFQRAHLYYPTGGESAFVSAGHNLVQFAFLAAAVPAVIGVLRRLPVAYGAYVIAALALPLSYPTATQPLMSLPRFLLVLFPLAIWLAAWLAERPRLQRPALVGSAALMALFGAEFTTWHWVA